MSSMNNQLLNNNISEMFDQAMSDNLINNKILDKDEYINENLDQIEDEYINENQNEYFENDQQQSPIKQQSPVKQLSPVIQKDELSIIKPEDMTPEQYKIYDDSKKALIGAFIYILLSLPHLNIVFNKLIPNTDEYNLLKIILLKALIFPLVFIGISRFI